jgi:hypothetical protein
MNRARVLAQARAASAPAPVSVVAYTETELAERQAYAELATLARRWRKRAAAERVLRALDLGGACDPAPFLLTRRLAAATTHPLVRYVKTLQGLRPTVVH